MQFVEVWRAETLKLFSRTTAKVGLVVAAGLGILGPISMWLVMNMGMTMNGADVSEQLTTTAPNALQWALEIRNFFFMRALIIVLAALSFAAEFRARTIREDLLRPVPRWMVPIAKWLAINVWVAASVVVSLVYGGLLAVVVFGFDGEWVPALVGWTATILADAGFAALALLISIASRSVAGTVAGVFLFLVMEKAFSVFLSIVSAMSGLFEGMGIQLSVWMKRVIELKPWLPSSAFDFWVGYADATQWDWRSAASLAIITVVSVVGSERIFNRVDVP